MPTSIYGMISDVTKLSTKQCHKSTKFFCEGQGRGQQKRERERESFSAEIGLVRRLSAKWIRMGEAEPGRGKSTCKDPKAG